MAQGGVDITASLEGLGRRLVDAAAIAQAAVTCARSGSQLEAVGISMQRDLLLGKAQFCTGPCACSAARRRCG